MKRRSFLKAGAALGLVPLIEGCSFNGLSNSVNPNLVANGEVITAGHWGALKITLKDGRIVKSEPLYHRSDVANTLRGQTADLVYTPTRIKAPYVRKSYLENPDSPKPELRGKDEWVEVSLEDAAKLVARELKKTREQKGMNSIFAGSYGWYSPGNLHNAKILMHRFMNLTGGFTGILGDYSTGAAQMILPRVVGSMQVYEQQTSWPVVLENSELVILWGMNPMATLRVSWQSTDEFGFHYLEKLRDSGKKLYVIDPVRSATVKFFGDKATHIRTSPNTDVAMMMGIAYHLFTNKKYDRKFLDEYTVGFDKFTPYLMGKEDGIKKTPKWAEKICGVPANVITKLADEMWENRTMIMAGWVMQRQDHGEQPHWMIVTLASMLGQVGLPGGGWGFSYHYSNGGNPTKAGAPVGGMNAASTGAIKDGKFIGLYSELSDEEKKGVKVADAAYNFPCARIAEAIMNPGKTIDFNGRKVTYPEIDFIYWCGGNNVNQQQQLNKYVPAWRKPRTVVVNDIYWTPTAKHADIVFPITSIYERNDLTMLGDYANYGIVPMKQLVEKQHKAVDDYTVFTELCKAYTPGDTALVEKYTDGGKTEMDWLEQYYNSAKNTVNKNDALVAELAEGDENDTTITDKGLQANGKMPEFKTFWETNKVISFEDSSADEEYVTFADFREDPILEALGTPSGLIEIYSEDIEKMHYEDCKPHPTWFEPVEWQGMKNKPARFSLICPHGINRLHSQQNNTSLRDTYAIANREPVIINPADAKELGIKTGDLVRLFNERGECLAGADVSDDVPRNVVHLFEGAWYDPNENGLCKNGCANMLTLDKPTSKLAVSNISETALVNVEKYVNIKGEDIELTAFVPPKGAK